MYFANKHSGGWLKICCLPGGIYEEGPHRWQQRLPRACPQQGVFQRVYWALSFWQNCHCYEERAICWERSPACCYHPVHFPHTSTASLRSLLVGKLPNQRHHHIFSTLTSGTATSLRLNHMVNGGLCWRNKVMGGGWGWTTLQLLKFALSAHVIFVYLFG